MCIVYLDNNELVISLKCYADHVNFLILSGTCNCPGTKSWLTAGRADALSTMPSRRILKKRQKGQSHDQPICKADAATCACVRLEIKPRLTVGI